MTELADRIVGGKIMPKPTGAERDPKDPPVFILLASPAFAPWLPDTAFQKVPIGATGQVLTVNADGSIGWSNSSAGFSNPMTSTGDLIDGGSGGTPLRLAIGSSGQVLTVVSGSPAWAAAVGFANPMTTTQDLIVGGASGAAGRLPVGSNAQVLTVTGGLVGWANAAAGFANPMTTLGDIITAASGGTAQRLGVGANAQVLTVTGGVPGWANSASGFANPMTAQGDMISGGLVGAAQRLPIGANGQVLTVVSGNPAWTSGSSGPSAVVFPSGDATGVTDQANITATWTSGPLSHGGEVLLANGVFYVKPTSGLNCLAPPAQTYVAPVGRNLQGQSVSVRGCGSATLISPVGAGVTGIYYHRTTSYGAQFAQAAQPTTGYLRDFVIDGTNTSGAATGLDVGDGWGYDINLRVVNFDTTGATGFIMAQDVFWCEKGDYRVELINNTTAALLTTRIPGSDHSNEYNRYWFSIFSNQNQNGVILDGSNNGGSELWLRGNMCQTTATSGAPTGNVAALTIRNTTGQNSTESRWYFGEIHFKVEANNTAQFPTGSVMPYGIFMDGVARGIQECSGRITHSLTNSNINGAEFSFRGLIGGDPNLAQAYPVTGSPHATGTGQPSIPASGTAVVNGGPDFQVGVTNTSGGTITGVSINGQATGAAASAAGAYLGPFVVCAAGSITLNYTGTAPTWNWAPAAQSS